MKLLRYFYLAGVFVSCQPQERGPVLLEEKESKHTGIQFKNQLNETGEINIIEYLYFYNGGGVGIADFNKDGWEDIIFTGNQVPNSIYINKGNLQFEDITESSGINNIQKGWSTGVSIVDINEDGWMDIYICQVSGYAGLTGHNLLLINNQDLTFSEKSKEYGLDFSGFSTQAAFFDADRDGDNDLYLVNHAVHTPYSYQPADSRTPFDSVAGDRFFRCEVANNRIRYIDVSQKVGIYSGSQGFGLGLVIQDFNLDMWPDIYVANDFHEDDFLYINQHDGTFKEARGDFFPHTSRFTMGVDAADLNNDGKPDLMTVDMLPFEPAVLLKSGGEDREKVAEIKRKAGYLSQVARNVMQINETDHFTDIALITDTYASDWSWSVLMEDLDQNGKRDIFISNGIARRPNDLDYINFLSNINLSQYNNRKQDSLEQILIKRMPDTRVKNQLYLQHDSLVFQKIHIFKKAESGDYSNGTAMADLDQDGDLDLVINRINDLAILYENTTNKREKSHWITLEFLKDAKQSMVTGRIFSQGKVFHFSTYPIRGWLSSQPYRASIGVGTNSQIDSLWVIWPNGNSTKHFNLPIDRNVSVHYEAGIISSFSTSYQVSSRTKTLENWQHSENNFLDFDNEPLIPTKLSKEGPAVAVGDVNGDGFEDVYIGGAHGYPGRLFHSNEGVLMVDSTNFSLWESEKFYEDISAVFFDFDFDDDLDLYVVSGGNEYSEGKIQLQDRLYINEGSGTYSKSMISLPAGNGSVVEVINQKDKHTLFIGSRNKPGSYGLIPDSYFISFYKNQPFPEIEKIKLGMVTDARWSNEMGLAVVGEWMPISILNFSDKQWSINTIPNSIGLWRSVEWADYNGDGQLDILAGNLGLNSKFKIENGVSPTLYVGDFDQNGQSEPIIFYPYQGKFVPYAHRDDLVSQLPIIKKNFLSYAQFATVTSLNDLFPNVSSKNWDERKTDILESGVFIQEKNTFCFLPFPKQFQLSPMNDIVWNGKDLIATAQNFLDAGSNQGPYDSFSGGIIYRNGKNSEWNWIKEIVLPAGVAFRHVVRINGQWIWVANNERAYLLDSETNVKNYYTDLVNDKQ